jgi:hypothetical protein
VYLQALYFPTVSYTLHFHVLHLCPHWK